MKATEKFKPLGKPDGKPEPRVLPVTQDDPEKGEPVGGKRFGDRRFAEAREANEDFLNPELRGPVQLRALEQLDVVPNKITSQPPEPTQMRPDELWVDRSYQRNLSRKSMNLIHKIVSGWDWTKFKPPVVSKDDDGRYLVIDGQHTSIAACMHPDIETIPVMVVELEDIADQANSFLGHNMDRIAVPALDIYQARLTAGDELTIMADKILRKHGISVVRSLGNVALRENQTVATQEILRLLAKHGQAKFTQIVEFIANCGLNQIRSDHWKFAENLLTNKERSITYTPSMMQEVMKATNQLDAYNEARKIASSVGGPIHRGLTLYYMNRYRQLFGIK